MRRIIKLTVAFTALISVALGATTSVADACAGLIGSNGAVNLGRTTTLAGYHNGVEHYVTAFQFQGGGGQFGTLIPLPGVPTEVERGGAWTLQRLGRETEPVGRLAALSARADNVLEGAQVLIEKRIDALDITVLKGGGPAIAAWAEAHGFRLSPDAPEVLDFYTSRSPIFLAAVFDGAAAAERGQKLGDGTPVHLTIPTSNPWVPLRILSLGRKATEQVQADVYLLTDDIPALLPGPRPGLSLVHSAKASKSLLDDLRSDDGMGWVPQSSWLTKLRIDSPASEIRYDLAVDASGKGQPSPVAAGLARAKQQDNGRGLLDGSLIWVAAGLVGVLMVVSAMDLGFGRAPLMSRGRLFRPLKLMLVVCAGLAVLTAAACATGASGSQASSNQTIVIRHSHFGPKAIKVPVGVPVTFSLRNDDPIEHEWIVGSEEVHERHRTGTEPAHDQIATEVTIPPLTTKFTTVTFDKAGDYAFICHLPGHEAYGMKGKIRVLAN